MATNICEYSLGCAHILIRIIRACVDYVFNDSNQSQMRERKTADNFTLSFSQLLIRSDYISKFPTGFIVLCQIARSVTLIELRLLSMKSFIVCQNAAHSQSHVAFKHRRVNWWNEGCEWNEGTSKHFEFTEIEQRRELKWKSQKLRCKM